MARAARVLPVPAGPCSSTHRPRPYSREGPPPPPPAPAPPRRHEAGGGEPPRRGELPPGERPGAAELDEPHELERRLQVVVGVFAVVDAGGGDLRPALEADEPAAG